MYMDTIKYRLNIFSRVVLSCVGGYLCTMYFSLVLASLFTSVMPRAEAVFLSAFLAILFFVFFFMTSFAIHSFKHVMVFGLSTTALFYILSYILG
ncbi:hypothetical protein SAMN05444584_0987 [Acinetobacter apis]|uniref:Iron uptake protein n=1 Tax=Acinetobacter apis TaxID=1229165 RepID=A0A217EEZ7_9GAMM|nr:hypothetical protein SAMN05444584_0987 [Acinetobacter apis]